MLEGVFQQGFGCVMKVVFLQKHIIRSVKPTDTVCSEFLYIGLQLTSPCTVATHAQILSDLFPKMVYGLISCIVAKSDNVASEAKTSAGINNAVC